MQCKNVISEGFASNKYWLLRDALNQKQKMQFSNQTSEIELNVVARSCIFQKIFQKISGTFSQKLVQCRCRQCRRRRCRRRPRCRRRRRPRCRRCRQKIKVDESQSRKLSASFRRLRSQK